MIAGTVATWVSFIAVIHLWTIMVVLVTQGMQSVTTLQQISWHSILLSFVGPVGGARGVWLLRQGGLQLCDTHINDIIWIHLLWKFVGCYCASSSCSRQLCTIEWWCRHLRMYCRVYPCMSCLDPRIFQQGSSIISAPFINSFAASAHVYNVHWYLLFTWLTICLFPLSLLIDTNCHISGLSFMSVFTDILTSRLDGT